jgi:hypothetical protein
MHDIIWLRIGKIGTAIPDAQNKVSREGELGAIPDAHVSGGGKWVVGCWMGGY